MAGARSRIVGPGIDRTVISGRGGRVSAALEASGAGVVTVSWVGAKGCGQVRIGVVPNAVETPVTG